MSVYIFKKIFIKTGKVLKYNECFTGDKKHVEGIEKIPFYKK